MAGLDWENFKGEIVRLYINDDKSLQGEGGVIDCMGNLHGFRASKSQYESRLRSWNIRKNLKGFEWRIVATHLERRRRKGLESDVYINNVHIPSSKVRREIRRYRGGSTSNNESSSSDQLPPGVLIRPARVPNSPQRELSINLRPADKGQDRLRFFDSQPESLFPYSKNDSAAMLGPAELNAGPCLNDSPETQLMLPLVSNESFDSYDLSGWQYPTVDPFSDPEQCRFAWDHPFNSSFCSDFLFESTPFLSIPPQIGPLKPSHSGPVTGAPSGAITRSLSSLRSFVLDGFKSNWGRATFTTGERCSETAIEKTMFLLLNSSSNPRGREFIDHIQDLMKDQGDFCAFLISSVLELPELVRDALIEKLFPLAIDSKNTRLVESLLDLGAEPNQDLAYLEIGTGLFSWYFTPVGRAAWLGDLDTVQMLLRRNASVNLVANHGWHSLESSFTPEAALLQMLRFTPGGRKWEEARLHSDQIAIVEVLVQHGGVIDSTVMRQALERRHFPLIALLLELSHGPAIEDLLSYDFFKRLMELFNDDEIVALVLLIRESRAVSKYFEWEAKPNTHELRWHPSRNSTGLLAQARFSGTVLDMAALGAHSRSSRVLRDMGLIPSTRTLVCAILGGASSFAEDLLSTGLDELAPVRFSWTLSNSYPGSLVDTDGGRLDTGRDYSYVKTDITPYSAAIEVEDARLMSLLQMRGVWKCITQNAKFYPAITAASRIGNRHLVQQLLSMKPDIHPRRLTKSLLQASFAGHTDIALSLLRHDALHYAEWPSKGKGHGETTLGQAISQKDYALTMACLAGTGSTLRSSFGHFEHRSWWNVVRWGNRDVIDAMRQRHPTYERYLEFAILNRSNDLARHIMATENMVYYSHSQWHKRDDEEYVGFNFEGLDVHPEQLCCALSAALLFEAQDATRYLISHSVNVNCAETWLCVARDETMLNEFVAEHRRRFGNTKTQYATLALAYLIAEQATARFEILLSICDVNYPIEFNRKEPFVPPLASFSKKSSEAQGLSWAGESWKSWAAHSWPKNYCYSAFGYSILRDTSEDLRFINLIMDAGGNLHQFASPGKPPLHLAIDLRNIEKVQLLLDRGAESEHIPEHGAPLSALRYACMRGCYDIVKLLLDYGADPNTPHFRDRRTALQYAALFGYVGIVELLVQFGADINEPRPCGGPSGGLTALECAAQSGHVRMVEYLLRNGVQTRGDGAESLKGAIRHAKTLGHRALARFLETLQGRNSSLGV